MPQFKLTAVNDDGVSITSEFATDYLPSVINAVSDFLHGAGFEFYDIDVVTEESVYAEAFKN